MVELVKSIKSVDVFISASYYFLTALLLFTGISKVLDPQPLFETIKAVINVSEELQIVSATLLPVLEITLGVMLLSKTRVKETLIAVTILFMFFFLFSVYGTVVGLENNCGCFGNAIKSEFGITMSFRNLVLLILSFFLLVNKRVILPTLGTFSIK